MLKFIIPFTAALWMVACSSPAPKAEKAPEPPPEPVGAQKGFFRTYPSARQWSPDVLPIRVESVAVPELKGANGKFAAWKITYVSEAKGKAKVYTYSVVESPGNVYKDVFSPLEERWGGPSGQSLPFRMEAFKIESDKALATAREKVKAYVDKHPGKEPNVLVEFNKRFSQPTYRFYWGDSIAKAEQTVFIDAATGEFVAKEP